MKNTFVHLHVHTPFSFLDGASNISQLVERASKFDMSAIAITDHNSLSGAVRFIKIARRFGLKPILGSEVTLKNGGHLTLIALNRKGYANLCHILTHAHLSSDRKNPQTNLQVIEENKAGIVVLSGCKRGEIPGLILKKRFNEAKEKASQYRATFGNNFYLEIQSTLFPGERALNKYLLELSKALHIKLVTTNNVHYATKSEFKLQDILTCIRTLTKLEDPHPERKINGELYLKSTTQMYSIFRKFPEALVSTQEIAECCENYELSGNAYRPKFGGLNSEAAQNFLRKLTYEGALSRYKPLSSKVRQRLEYELSIIERLGFAGYFLIAHDIVQYAKSKAIRYAGRGSAADSAVAYCLGITSVDSIARNLMFERFINPERSDNLPDIDIDFDARYRDNITDWVIQKYGHDKVGGVCTFSCYRARGALRDIGKVMNFPMEEIGRLAKLIPWVEADEIRQALAHFPELKQSKIPAKRFSQLFDFCAAIAGHPRHIGTHLCGIVITGHSVIDLSPLQKTAKGINILQFDKEDVEDLELLKLDLLCLRMLSAVEDTVQMANNDNINRLDFNAIPLDDKPTYNMLHTGETVGMFQLESPAQRALQRRLKSENIEDVVASVALIRPGPVQGDMVNPFIQRRQGSAPVTYIHPKLEKILKKTYGVVLFQEQVVEIACEIAKFSPGEADLLRRAMTHNRSKKEMEEIGKMFINKAFKYGVNRKLAETVFSYIRGYAGYGFCEAHAAAFGDTAYKTAYLLKHHPAYFYAALLSNQPMGFYPPHTLINEAERQGINILPPDINQSKIDYSVEGNAIRVGLKQVRGISKQALDSILQAKPISSLHDFLIRTSVPRDITENLILCGAFDSLHENRKALMWMLCQESHLAASKDFLQLHSTSLPNIADYKDEEKFSFEWQILGFSPRKHPMEYFRERLKTYGVVTNQEAKKFPPGKKVKVVGLIIRPHRPPTRSGKTVVFFSLEDETGILDITVFENVYKVYGGLIFCCHILLIQGHIDRRGTNSLIAEKISEIPKHDANLVRD